MLPGLLRKEAKTCLMKERSWNLIEEENLLFSGAEDPMGSKAGVRVWVTARVSPGSVHIRVLPVLNQDTYFICNHSAPPRTTPFQGWEDDSQGWTFGSRGGGVGDRGDGLGNSSHLPGRSDQSISFSTPLSAPSIRVCSSPGWLVQPPPTST